MPQQCKGDIKTQEQQAFLPVQDPHDPPLHSSAVLPTAPPRRLGCTLHATIYFFNIMLTNGTAYEKWQAFHFIQNMRNLNKHQLPSHVYIPLLLKVVLYSVNKSSDTERRMTVHDTPPSAQESHWPSGSPRKDRFPEALVGIFFAMCIYYEK